MGGSTTPDLPNACDQPQTIPNLVIEQAKRIVAAELGCSAEDAFEVLCGASQHANVKLIVLAGRLVDLAASGNGLNVLKMPVPAVVPIRGTAE